MKSFRENLRDELDYQGITVKELALKTGIIKGSLDNYLGARQSIPPADVAVKIAKSLNVSVEYLVTGEDAAHQESRGLYNQFKSTIVELNRIPSPIQDSIRDLIHKTAENCFIMQSAAT